MDLYKNRKIVLQFGRDGVADEGREVKHFRLAAILRRGLTLWSVGQ